MATNPPSTIRVTLGQNTPTVTTIGYGTRTLKSASDLDLTNAADGLPIVYRADTNSFEVAPVTVDAGTIDSGFF